MRHKKKPVVRQRVKIVRPKGKKLEFWLPIRLIVHGDDATVAAAADHHDTVVGGQLLSRKRVVVRDGVVGQLLAHQLGRSVVDGPRAVGDARHHERHGCETERDKNQRRKKK